MTLPENHSELNDEYVKMIAEHFGKSWVGVTAMGMFLMIKRGDVQTLDEALSWGLNQPNNEEHHETIQLAYQYLKDYAVTFNLPKQDDDNGNK
jgi:hypothetical protein